MVCLMAAPPKALRMTASLSGVRRGCCHVNASGDLSPGIPELLRLLDWVMNLSISGMDPIGTASTIGDADQEVSLFDVELGRQKRTRRANEGHSMPPADHSSSEDPMQLAGIRNTGWTVSPRRPRSERTGLAVEANHHPTPTGDSSAERIDRHLVRVNWADAGSLQLAGTYRYPLASPFIARCQRIQRKRDMRHWRCARESRTGRFSPPNTSAVAGTAVRDDSHQRCHMVPKRGLSIR
jgi:hypothetical protein